MDFFTGGCIIMDYDIWPEAALTDGLESIFLSAVWTLILTAPIHCR